MVSIPKRVSEVLKLLCYASFTPRAVMPVSIPKRVSEVLKLIIKIGYRYTGDMFQSLKGFQRF